jgi:hypothetical protein
MGIKSFLGINPFFHEYITKGVGKGKIDIKAASHEGISTLKTHKMVLNCLLELLDASRAENV